MIGALVIGHGDFAQSLVDAVFAIAGKQDRVVAISNKSLSMENLRGLIKEKIEEMGEVIVFTDLPGGSCTIACKSLRVPVITGVNLPILLEFALMREKWHIEELTENLQETGRKSIRRM